MPEELEASRTLSLLTSELLHSHGPDSMRFRWTLRGFAFNEQAHARLPGWRASRRHVATRSRIPSRRGRLPSSDPGSNHAGLRSSGRPVRAVPERSRPESACYGRTVSRSEDRDRFGCVPTCPKDRRERVRDASNAVSGFDGGIATRQTPSLTSQLAHSSFANCSAVRPAC